MGIVQCHCNGREGLTENDLDDTIFIQKRNFYKETTSLLVDSDTMIALKFEEKAVSHRRINIFR